MKWQKRIGDVHMGARNKTVCGRPMLGNNYWNGKSLVDCPECLKIMQGDRQYPLQSNCCGNPPKGNGDSDSSELGFCPSCKEHCEYGYHTLDGDFFYREAEAIEQDSLTLNKP